MLVWQIMGKPQLVQLDGDIHCGWAVAKSGHHQLCLRW